MRWFDETPYVSVLFDDDGLRLATLEDLTRNLNLGPSFSGTLMGSPALYKEDNEPRYYRIPKQHAKVEVEDLIRVILPEHRDKITKLQNDRFKLAMHIRESDNNRFENLVSITGLTEAFKSMRDCGVTEIEDMAAVIQYHLKNPLNPSSSVLMEHSRVLNYLSASDTFRREPYLAAKLFCRSVQLDQDIHEIQQMADSIAAKFARRASDFAGEPGDLETTYRPDLEDLELRREALLSTPASRCDMPFINLEKIDAIIADISTFSLPRQAAILSSHLASYEKITINVLSIEECLLDHRDLRGIIAGQRFSDTLSDLVNETARKQSENLSPLSGRTYSLTPPVRFESTSETYKKILKRGEPKQIISDVPRRESYGSDSKPFVR